MTKKYFLGILTYFKNEGNSIFEWIMHHKKWGVDHIWLINNGSQDDYNIEQFINDGYITLFNEPNMGQNASYQKYLPQIKKLVTWLGVFDMDEFLYSKQDNDLKKILKNNINSKTKLISIQMKLFLPVTFELIQ